MNKFLMAPLIVMIFSQTLFANVDLLSGAFQYQIAVGPQSLQYSSRRAETSSLGFGWCLQTSGVCLPGASPSNITPKLKNGDLIEIHLKQKIWSFKYDSFHNLLQVQDPDGQKLEIRYHEDQDRVATVLTTEGCRESYDYLETTTTLALTNKRICLDQELETIFLQAEFSGPEQKLRRLSWRRADLRSKTAQGLLLYDRRGRLVHQRDGLDSTSYLYDQTGSLTQMTRETRDEKGALLTKNSTRFLYDDDLRLKKILTTDRPPIQLNYDSSGRLQNLAETENTLAVALALQATLENLSPIEGGLTL